MYRGGSEELESELVPDHALVDDEGDLFGHTDLVNRLTSVLAEASTAHTSANIALYGSWGSGKSSVANLLEVRLDEEKRERERLGEPVRYRLFRFDAFKYAREPFLRQFIRQLADDQLDKDTAAKYKGRLYQERSSVEPRFHPNWWLLAWTLISLALVFVGLDGLLSGHAHQILVDVIHVALVALFSSTLALGGLALLLPFFSISTRSPVPDSDEQFERIFCDLLHDELEIHATSKTKLVVFVDELDRCSPIDVAATLETLRTFLGVKGCLFIVAADQQVLEQALTKHVRQATPPDPANPYYSAGSAYLDKIFQYQLALPPFRARRLVNFALQLVQGRAGVWQQVDLSEVIPILLPTHVHSPRRVKVLLNAFALTYGVADSRAERDELGAIRDRGPEIAKLVCLRVEFPLFARDLNLDDRLTAAVLTAATAYERKQDPLKSEELQALPVEIRRRAISFARGDLPAASLLAEGPAQAELDRTLLDFDDAAAEQSMVKSEGGPEEGEPGPAAPVRHSQGLQLVRYLEKSIDVSGPYSDLIHLEAAGATFGLDPQLAQQLERDALDRRQAAIVAAISALDQGGRVNAFRMLGQLAHESHGPDGRNAMQTLLRSLAASEVSLAQLAPYIAADLDAFSRRNKFAAEDLPGAFSIAVVAKRSGLAGRLLRTEAAVNDADFRAKILALGAHLEASSRPRLIEIATAALRADGAESAELILGLPKQLARTLLKGALAELEGSISSDLRLGADPESDPNDSEGYAARAGASIEQLGNAVQAFAKSDQAFAESALVPLLTLPQESADGVIDRCLEGLQPLRSPAAARALLDYSRRWILSRTVDYLESVDPAAVGAINAGLDPLIEHIHSETTRTEEDPPKALWSALRRLLSGPRRSHRPGRAAKALAAELRQRLVTDAEATVLDRRLALARRLAQAGALTYSLLAEALAETIALTAGAQVEPEEQAALARHFGPWVEFVADHAEPKPLKRAERALIGAGWLPSPARETMALRLSAALSKKEASPPSLDRIVDLSKEYGREAAPAVAIWIERFARTPEAAARAVGPYASLPLPEIVTALQRYTQHRDGALRTRLLLPLIEDGLRLRTDPKILRAARIDAADENLLATALGELAAGAENEPERQLPFDVWALIEPQAKTTWARLISEVLLRIAGASPTAFEAVRRRLEVCAAVPEELRPLVVDGMREALPPKGGKPDGKRARRLESSLAKAGLIEGKRRRFGIPMPF